VTMTSRRWLNLVIPEAVSIFVSSLDRQSKKTYEFQSVGQCLRLVCSRYPKVSG
jgi:hypothetical protein